MNNNKLYFKNLDSIRFIAALMVFLGHAVVPAFKQLPIDNTVWERFIITICNGETGVSIFFVLSGFLITYLLVNEYERHSKISLKNFYMRRVLRIWPLYFLILAFTFLIYPWFKSMMGMNSPLESNVFYHISFLSNFDVINVHKTFAGSDAMSQNITWSVSVEEQFYVFWPLIFVFLPRKLWIYAILSVIGGSLFFRIWNHKDALVLYFHTFSVLLDLGIGGMMALLIKSNLKMRTFFESTGTRTHIFLFLTSFCLMFWEDEIFDFPYGVAVSRIFISISFALIIASQAMTKRESKLNLGKMKFANKWGKYTYGIYLYHPIVLTLLDVLARVTHVPTGNFLNLIIIAIVAFGITLVISKLSFDYFESKFLALKSKFA